MTGHSPFSYRGVIDDDWFEREDGTPMTKAPVRSAVLSLLSPLAGAAVLEIGVGTGAVTVELLRAVGDGGLVTGVEVAAPALRVAAKNIERSGLAARAEIIAGRAPGAIPRRAFDAAFVGGHGSAIEAVIEACWNCLRPGGRLLLTAITPGTTAGALACLDSIGARVGFWRVHTSAGHRAGSEWLLLGNNPIDLIWGDR
jgi:precorrin-6Y C5,15-methyltransferase (decarboxylating) CbiT subunit